MTVSNQLTTKQSGFALNPANLNEAMQLASMICNSQLCPAGYKGKQEDTLIAMMMGNEIGLNPLQAIQNIAVINGRPSIYGDALMALVQNHPAFGGVNESFDELTMTATCTVWRKGGEKHTQTFSQADATEAKLWGKQGPWSQYKKRMLAMRARGFALRNQFADALAGLITREEAEDLPIEKEVNQAPQSSNSQATVKQIAEKPEFTQEMLNAKSNKWANSISKGSDPQDLIDMLNEKYTVCELIANQILNLNQEEAA